MWGWAACTPSHAKASGGAFVQANLLTQMCPLGAPCCRIERYSQIKAGSPQHVGSGPFSRNSQILHPCLLKSHSRPLFSSWGRRLSIPSVTPFQRLHRRSMERSTEIIDKSPPPNLKNECPLGESIFSMWWRTFCQFPPWSA